MSLEFRGHEALSHQGLDCEIDGRGGTWHVIFGSA